MLTKIRLSTYFWTFFLIFLFLSYVLPAYKFDTGTLTLFSVNSFLYGFFISPILGAQKARIDALHQIIRNEANSLFDIVLDLKRRKLPSRIRHHIQEMVTAYIKAKLLSSKVNGGEKEYEELITYCVDYVGNHKDEVEGVLADLVSNQKNRTDFNMQAGNKVYSNEWHIAAILFCITLGFILTINAPSNLLIHIVRALLCTGLTMLILNLIKLDSLTHKRAKQMWSPLQNLLLTNFYRVD